MQTRPETEFFLAIKQQTVTRLAKKLDVYILFVRLVYGGIEFQGMTVIYRNGIELNRESIGNDNNEVGIKWFIVEAGELIRYNFQNALWELRLEAMIPLLMWLNLLNHLALLTVYYDVINNSYVTTN